MTQKLHICTGKKCLDKGAGELLKMAKQYAPELVGSCACVKKCKFGPNVKVGTEIRTGQTADSIKSELDVLSGKKVMGGSARKRAKELFKNPLL